MDPLDMERLTAAGIDVADALARFMNNESLLLRCLTRFPEDRNYAELVRALGDGDAERAFTAAHTLKGVAGNLALRGLYQTVSELVERLRASDMEGARLLLGELESRYEQVTRALAGMR